MIPLRLLKKAINDKFDKNSDFDPSLKYFRHTQSSIDGTVSDNYPYGFYVFSTEDDILTMGDYVPTGANNVITFHLFSLSDQVSTQIENLIDDLCTKLSNSPTLDIEQYNPSNNWVNPTVGLLNRNIVEEPETGNWHAIINYTVFVGR